MKNNLKRRVATKKWTSPVVIQRMALRNALTLIELLVVIVILVTLVGGVLPVLSPNNESRKIDSASRGLKTYFQRAQTRAVRTGRPVGVAFRESSLGSGVALEVYQVENPRPFAGFSSQSTAKFYDPNPNDNTYRYIIEFGEGFGNNFVPAAEPVIPPRMVRSGDIIQIGNSRFKLKANRNEMDLALRAETGEEFYLPVKKFELAWLVSGPAPPTVPINAADVSVAGAQISYPLNYGIARQPVPTSESPFVLPKGVAIDMHASGIEGGANPTLLAANYGDNLKQLSLMFSPAGGMDSIYYNGRRMSEDEFNDGYTSNAPVQKITDASRFVLLIAQIELGGAPIMDYDDKQQVPDTWLMQWDDSDERLAEVREEVSWLNLDSRWMVVDGRNGKTKLVDNPVVDPRNGRFNQVRKSKERFAFQQIMDARRGGDNLAAIDPASQQ